MRSDRNTVWFMTENPDKFREASTILRPHGILLRQLRRPKVELQDSSLERIASFAAKTASDNVRGPLLVEDSGLFVETLGGFPGPFSSYAYETIGLNGILSLLGDRRRRAYFQTSVALGSTGSQPQVFTGIVKGSISRKIRGNAGFGYDPIFIPKGFRSTFGESTEAFKNKHSHRAKAFLKFAKWYRR